MPEQKIKQSFDPTQLIQALAATDDPVEKSAISAEFAIDRLPPAIAELARSCAVLNWFDEEIIAALLPLVNEEGDDSEPTWDAQTVHEQITSLAFVEHLDWGQAYHSQTAEGLLAKYSTTQPERFQAVAALAAPAYLSHSQDKLAQSEALYCYLVAGQHDQGRELLDELVFEASRREDWARVLSYYQVCEQVAEQPFVTHLDYHTSDYFTQAFAAYNGGNWDTALADYSRAIQLDPEDAVAYNNRGITYQKLGMYEQAAADYDRAIQLNPEYVNAYNNRGVAYRNLGQYEKAVADYNRTVQLKPEEAGIYYNRGNAYSLLGQHEQALTDYDQAIQLNPEDANAYNNRGAIYYDLGQYERAITDYDRAIQLNPEEADIYYNRGDAYSDLGQYEQALIDYDRAIQLNPEDAIAYNNRGVAYRNLGQYEQAVADYDRAIQLNLEDADVYYNRGFSLQFMSRWDEAKIAYQQALGIDASRWDFWFKLADIARRQDDIEAYAEAIERSRSLVCEDDLYDMACLESIAGNNEAALDYLARAVSEQEDWKKWAQHDPDLEWLREEALFWEIVG